MSLKRFHEAQADPRAGYELALAEIRRGRKCGHWIWYIFPQLTGLGHSPTARHYGIRDLAEAREFLRDPVLRRRLGEIAAAVRDQLARGADLATLMGSNLDALKLISSLTLFRAAARTTAREAAALDGLATVCHAILTAAEAQGYPPCSRTLSMIDEE